jgi:hypothetical protein
MSLWIIIGLLVLANWTAGTILAFHVRWEIDGQVDLIAAVLFVGAITELPCRALIEGTTELTVRIKGSKSE